MITSAMHMMSPYINTQTTLLVTAGLQGSLVYREYHISHEALALCLTPPVIAMQKEEPAAAGKGKKGGKDEGKGKKRKKK